jgi:two-component system KDP operon response regulator KdpE
MATILVVEDEANVRKLVAVNLVQRGHRVLEAESGEQAMKHLYEETPALMVLDIKLPDLSGWDMLDRLAEVPALPVDIPVLVMTASPVDQNIILNEYPTVVEILIKPFNIDRLIAAVQRVLLMNGGK